MPKKKAATFAVDIKLASPDAERLAGVLEELVAVERERRALDARQRKALVGLGTCLRRSRAR